MSVTSITSNSQAANSPATDNTVALPTKNLNQQDFLKLLVAQMSAQDPMNPQSNSDFAAQMAQFSALATSQTTEAKISQMLVDQQAQQANELLGRSVTLQAANGTLTTGIVSAVHMTNQGPALVVNGVLYGLDQVVAIQPPPPAGGH